MLNLTLNEKETGLFVPAEVKSTQILLATTLNSHSVCLSRFYKSKSHSVCIIVATILSLINLAVVAAWYRGLFAIEWACLLPSGLLLAMLTDMILKGYGTGLNFFRNFNYIVDILLLAAYCAGLVAWVSFADESIFLGLVHALPATYAVKQGLSVAIRLKQPQTPVIRINEDSFAGSSRMQDFEEHKESDGPVSVEDLN